MTDAVPFSVSILNMNLICLLLFDSVQGPRQLSIRRRLGSITK
jgi:hypothetical protein